MKFKLSADDFGLTKSITQAILEVVDSGALNSVSLMANGHAFDFAVRELKSRPHIECAVHLNFCEGRPIALPEKIKDLVDHNGDLHLSFQKLWFKYLVSSPTKRRSIQKQVFDEMDAQITKVKSAVPMPNGVSINSHQNFHFIPFIFDALRGLVVKHNISYVRTGPETFFISNDFGNFMKNFFSLNIAKHMLINALSIRGRKILVKDGICHPDQFIGFLYTGFMTENTILSALRGVMRMSDKPKLVEVLVHPGPAVPSEHSVWSQRKELSAYYGSPWRLVEKKSISSPKVAQLINELTTP